MTRLSDNLILRRIQIIAGVMFSTHCSGLEYLTRLSVLYLVDQHTSLYVTLISRSYVSLPSKTGILKVTGPD